MDHMVAVPESQGQTPAWESEERDSELDEPASRSGLIWANVLGDGLR